ncbi:hypothetical protein Tco_0308278 [Tanacetum coccineum]
MHREQAQQATCDEKLVPTEDRVMIGSSNLRIDPTLTQKDEKYQVILDIIKNSLCYHTFLNTANVPEIYIQQFWFTITKVKKSSFYQFDLDNKKCYKGKMNLLLDMFVDHMHQPWRTLGTIINRCLSGRRPTMTDFDLQEFTKIIIHYFLSKHNSISKRQGSLYNTFEDDGVLGRVKFISKGEEHQVYGKPILNILVIDNIQNSKAYKTFIALSTCLITPKKGRGKRAQGTKATVIPKKETVASKKKSQRRKSQVSQKLKAIELLSDASQLEIDTQKAIKANRRKRRFQHQSGGSSKGAGITPEVPDEPTRKSAILDEGFDDWGSTDDETLLYDDNDEQAEEILWVSTDDDEEDDESIDIENTNDERTKSDNDDHEMTDVGTLVEENADKEHEDNAEKVEEQKVDEEQHGDDQAENEQVRVPVLMTNKEKPNLLQSTSSHSIASNCGNKFLNNSPNMSLVEQFHEVKVFVIPEPTQKPPSTPLTPPLLATKVPATPAQANQVLESKALTTVLQRVFDLEKDVKELKQVYHSPVILESTRSQVPSVVDKYLGSSL